MRRLSLNTYTSRRVVFDLEPTCQHPPETFKQRFVDIQSAEASIDYVSGPTRGDQ